MAHDLLPFSSSNPYANSKPRCLRSLLCSNRPIRFGFLSTAFILTGLIVYYAFLSPHGPLLRLSGDWNDPKFVIPSESLLVDPKFATLLPNPTSESTTSDGPPSSSQASDRELDLGQIRDIVVRTRGFYSRDYSLNLGWNNVSFS